VENDEGLLIQSSRAGGDVFSVYQGAPPLEADALLALDEELLRRTPYARALAQVVNSLRLAFLRFQFLGAW
jgi:hypothetical protein